MDSPPSASEPAPGGVFQMSLCKWENGKKVLFARGVIVLNDDAKQ